MVHLKHNLNIVSGIIKIRLTTLNIKMIRNYQQKKKKKKIGKSKSAMEHQKLHGKLSESVLTIQTVSVAFYV